MSVPVSSVGAKCVTILKKKNPSRDTFRENRRFLAKIQGWVSRFFACVGLKCVTILKKNNPSRDTIGLWHLHY